MQKPSFLLTCQIIRRSSVIYRNVPMSMTIRSPGKKGILGLLCHLHRASPFYIGLIWFWLMFVGSLTVQAQCDATVPTFTVNLTGSPNGAWISPTVVRKDNCCGTSSPDRCVRFIITLDPTAQGILFNVYSGAIPPGAMYYQINCGPAVKVGTTLCLDGPGPHVLTFCKPGNNSNQYLIQSIAPPGVLSLNKSCTGLMYTFGYDESTITWNSVFPGAPGAYNSYLSCTSGCDSTYATAQAGFPPYVEYQVCGTPLSECSIISVCDTIRVYFNPDLIAAIAPNVPVVCTGGATTISAIPSGGTPPFTYQWSTGASTQSISVGVGSYSVTIGDASSGCPPDSATVTVIQDPPFVVTPTQTNLTCNSICNGSASVAVSGASPPYTYSWSSAGGSAASATGLCAGSHTVSISDALGCFTSSVFNITQPTAVAVNSGSINVSCNGENDGSATATPTGGTPGYTYSWSNGITTQTIAGLSPGSYSIEVTDDNGCTAIDFVTITEPAVLTATVAGTNASCKGGDDGTVTISPLFGTAPYSYAWTPGNQSTQTATGLIAGSYTCTITDFNGCTTTGFVTITEPLLLTASAAGTSISCYGGADGTVEVNAGDGSPPYTYLWSNNSTSRQVSGLIAGTYSVTVTDNNGCTSPTFVTITEPSPLVPGMSFIPTICTGSVGTASVSVAGGTAPYDYAWANGSTMLQASGLAAGTYSVIITDNLGCTEIVFVTVTSAVATLTISISKNDVSCYGGNDAYASFTVSGGTTPYTYLWDNASTVAQISNLSAGTYSLLVTDLYGCTSSVVLGINQPAPLVANGSVISNALCFGGNEGIAEANANGGTSPYTYLWSTGSTNQQAGNLGAGTYTVEVTDNNGCVESTTVSITEPPDLSIIVISPISCTGGTGVSIQVNGGTTPYGYLWSTGHTDAVVTGLAPGTYTLTVSDDNDCADTVLVTAQINSLFVSASVVQDVSCNGGSDAIINANAAGGTLPYNYLWSNGSTDQQVSNLTEGVYSVTVTESGGCAISSTVTVTQPPVLMVTPATTDVSCNGDSDGFAMVNPSGGILPYTYLWSNGVTNQQSSGLAAGTYSVILTDDNGCIATTTLTINEPGLLTATAVATDASCNGYGDGSATLNASGGTTPYNYAWDNGFAGSQIINLTAGVYNATLTDNNGCIITQSVVVDHPTVLTSTVSVSNVLCKGESNGIANLSVSGGTAPYAYAWSSATGWQTTQNASNLAAGSYSCTVTDFNGCTLTVEGIVTEPPVLSYSVTQTKVSCFGLSDGTAALSPTGGALGYTYSWNPSGETSQMISNLAAGVNSFTISDVNGCVVSGSVTIIQPALLTVTTSQTNLSCFGDSNGSATANPAGGTPSYTYLWDPSGQTSQMANNLSAGTYTFTVSDTKGCSATGTVTITQPPVLDVTIIPSAVSCNGNNDGAATATPSGGIPGYTYLWSPSGQINPNINGLSAGTYSLLVTDANGCTVIDSAIITQPLALTASELQTNAFCYAESNGTATVTPAGGTPGYTYLWSPSGQTSQIASNLYAGTHSYMLTDANGCTFSSFVIITHPPPLTATTSVTDVLCNGDNSGTATISPSGGTPGYAYLWTLTGQTGQADTGLLAGVYFCTVTDTNGCSVSSIVNIAEPDLIVLNTNSTPAICTNAIGTASVNVSGGLTPYTYSWNNGVTTDQTSNLAAGTYTVLVTDANACTQNALAVITTSVNTLTLTISKTDVSCFGGNDGSANVNVVGGNSPYTYSWSNGATTQQTSNLLAGTYSVTVTDINGCNSFISIGITQPSLLVINASVVSDVSCAAGNDGSLRVNAGGGTPGYSYLWSNNESTQQITNLIAGTYSVLVTDGQGCIATATVSITEPTPIAISVVVNPTACNGGTTGTSSIQVGGGTPPYNYLWNTGDTTPVVSGLGAGTYTLIVTDDNGCSDEDTINITQPNQLFVSASVLNDALCKGNSDGLAAVNAIGGTPAYTYQWSQGSTDQQASNLPSGVYSVTVSDNNGCSLTHTVSVTEPPLLTISTSATDVNCNTGNNGSGNVSASGGTTAYAYLWSNSSTTPQISNLVAGTYSITVRDNNGCTEASFIEVTQPSALIASIVSISVTCFGDNDASANVTASGGTAAYNYTWSNASAAQQINDLLAGVYTATVTDNNGCINIDTVNIPEPSILTATLSATDVFCFGGNTGTMMVNPAGGIPGYTYLWSPSGQSMQIASNLTAGTYTVFLTDMNGCSMTDAATITQPLFLWASPAQTDVSCFGGSDGSTTITPFGGVPGYFYSWNNSATTPSITGLSAGSYSVTIEDVNNCNALANVNITQPPLLTFTMVTTDVNCNLGSNGTISVNASGGTNPYTYLWSNNATTSSISGLVAGSYSVVVTDNNNCIATNTVTITEPAPLSLTLTPVDAHCSQSDGSMSSTVSGGITNYIYLWSNGATTASIMNVDSSVYSLTVTDANLCTITSSDTVHDLLGVTAQIVSSNSVTCNGVCNGEAIASGLGGDTPYAFLWSTGATDTIISGLCAGSFTVVVTDKNGCTSTEFISIPEPTVLTATISATDVFCFNGNDGTASVSASGGVAPYSYLWNSSETTQQISNLVAGNYSVTIADANSCTVVKNITVIQPTVLTTTISGTDVSCNFGSNGTASVNAGGGTNPYTYLWSNSATTSSISGLVAGSYSVVVTDNNNCIATNTVTITEPAPLSLTLTPVDAHCSQSDGSMSSTVSGGITNYIYLWSNGATTASIMNVDSSVYSLTVTDANLCTITSSDTVHDLLGVTAQIVSSNSVTCNGVCNGEAIASGLGGDTPYAFLWSTGATDTIISGLCAGSFTVVVTDNNGCTSTEFISIPEPTVLTATISATDVFCFNGNDGTASVSASGGVAPYSYLWNSSETTQQISNLVAGNYSVTIADANSCTVEKNITVTQPTVLTTTISGTDVSCSFGSNGTASVNAGGGINPYTYLWSNSATTSSISGLVAGSYSVVVTDNNNCITTNTVTITEPAPLSLSLTPVDAHCSQSDGSMSSTVSGGITNYIYLWSNGATTASIMNVDSSVYSLTVTDANLCTITSSDTVHDLLGVTAQIVSSNSVTCNGVCNGEAIASGLGGDAPYAFLWSTGATDTIVSGLCAGSFTVVVTDNNGCTSTEIISIPEPTVLTSTLSSTDVACYGNNDGAAFVSAMGGVTPYSYAWNNGETTSQISNLTVGTYFYSVTDSNGCISTGTVVITAPTLLVLQMSNTNVSCYGGSNASANVIASGGLSGYSYSWSNGVTTQMNNLISASVYNCTVTDTNGCIQIDSVTITEPTVLTIDSTYTDVLCNGDANGTASVTPSGGTPGYTYLWSNGISSQNINALAPGLYTCTVTDANGCFDTSGIFIIEPPLLSVFASGATSACGGKNVTLSSYASGGTSSYNYLWSPGAGNDSVIVVSPFITTDYTLVVTDANGCTNFTIQTVTVFPLPTVAFNANTECLGTALSFSDNTTGNIIQWTWNFGESSSGVNNTSSSQSPSHNYATSGSFAVKLIVSTADGCVDSVTQSVIVNPVPAANFGATTVCYGKTSAFADLSTVPSGNITAWAWNFNDPNSGVDSVSNMQNPSHNFSASGIFNVSLAIMSDNGCWDTIVVPVTVEALPVADFGVVNNCYNQPAAFSDSSTLANQWFWDFGHAGDTSILQNPTHTYTDTGNYVVNLMVITPAGCKDSITKTIMVHSLPYVNFAADTVCVWTPTSFTDSSSIPGGTIVAWSWDFGDGTALDTMQNPQHIFATSGLHNVILTATTENGCSESFFLPVLVNPQPVAEFSYSPLPTVELGNLVYFTDESYSNILQWSWDFDDGYLSNEINPYHLFTDTGKYKVTLMVENNYGCLDTSVHPIEVNQFSFFIPNSFTPNGDGMNDFFFGEGLGIDIYEFWIFDRWGNLIFECNINGLPQNAPCQWDGKVQGGRSDKTVQEDVYVWLVKYKDVFGIKHRQVGHVTVVR